MKEGLVMIKKKGFVIFLITIASLGSLFFGFQIVFGDFTDKIFSLNPNIFFAAVAGFVFYKFKKSRIWIGGVAVLYFFLTSEKGGEILSNINWLGIFSVILIFWVLTKQPKKKKS